MKLQYQLYGTGETIGMVADTCSMPISPSITHPLGNTHIYQTKSPLGFVQRTYQGGNEIFFFLFRALGYFHSGMPEPLS